VLLSLDVRYPEQPMLKENRCYYVWKYGRPDAVAEIVSNREGEELGKKMEIYARVGVPYYIVWDPFQLITDTHNGSPQGLRCFLLVGKKYEACASWFPALGLGVVEWYGTFENSEGTWLRWCDQQGNVIPTGEERAELEQRRAERERVRAHEAAQRADEEKQRADEEKLRADEEKQRAEQLAAQLRALGIEPETR
jgi:hypothetical protein